jgi:phosphopantothenate-cysteine ligase
MKKILITSGGTREYIDDVRVLTNISSGKLGAIIADKFIMSSNWTQETKKEQTEFRSHKDYDVYYVYAKGSEVIEYLYSTNFHTYEVTDVASLMKVMEELVPQMDIVIHLMAVSDFAFKPISTKLKSSDPEAFIESMKERIYKTPKVLSHIKEWNPNCFLVSFKFEVGLTLDELYNIAIQSMVSNQCDVVVANDKAEMIANGKHIAHIIEKNYHLTVESKEEIAEKLFKIIHEI